MNTAGRLTVRRSRLTSLLRWIMHPSTRRKDENQDNGILLVKEHGNSRYANRLVITKPDAGGHGGSIDCTCNVPSRFRFLCCDALAALKSARYVLRTFYHYNNFSVFYDKVQKTSNRWSILEDTWILFTESSAPTLFL